MDLRTGTPLWLDISGEPTKASHLDRNVSCDVLVIGSGVTGAMTALHLAESGLEVIVVDRRSAASGSTPASTALVQYDIDIPLIDLRSLVGKASADLAYRATRAALDDLTNLITRFSIQCDFTLRPGLYLAGTGSDVELLVKENEARVGLGIETEYLSKAALKNRFVISRPAAIYSAVQYELNPCKLSYQLLERAVGLGAHLYSNTEVEIERDKHHKMTAITSTGFRIKARDVVFATGYETPEIFPSLKKLCDLKSTYVIASAPLDPEMLWRDRALLWEHADPYLYARCSADNRIIAGGGDEPSQNPKLRDKLIGKKSAKIVEKLNMLFPALDLKVEYQWAGTFAETPDGLPLIGIPDKRTNCFFALGYGGNGITYSLLAAQIITDLITNTANQLNSVFGFERLN